MNAQVLGQHLTKYVYEILVPENPDTIACDMLTHLLYDFETEDGTADYSEQALEAYMHCLAIVDCGGPVS